MIDATHVRQTSDLCAGFLRQSLDADWSGSIPDIDMSIAQTVGHIAEGLLWYAIDLAAGGADLGPVEHRVKTDGERAELLDTLQAYGTVVASVIDGSPETARGFHPMGTADPSGFAAMACDELLIHTDDIARGLGRSFEPPPDLAAAVVWRLFPWITEISDPWRELRWANGRLAMDDRPRLTGWRWHCAPLAQWDGTTPQWLTDQT